MRIFAVSDLHTDFPANWQRLRETLAQPPADKYADAVLLVAGDIADDLAVLAATLELLRTHFAQVFYVPGNHELWVRSAAYDSLEKLQRVLALCARLDVQTCPAQVGGVWVVPLLSWYEAAFAEATAEATAEAIAGEAANLEAWADRYFCRWPLAWQRGAREINAIVSAYCGARNQPYLKTYPAPVITFSHFLPRPELLPPTRLLSFKGLPQVAGSHALDQQVRQVHSRLHVFGHSHIDRDCVLDGVRYVQHHLGYPREQTRQGAKPLFKLVLEK